jgi:hypothetical protein
VYRTPTGTFGITTPINGETATFGNGSTFGFAAKSPAEVDALIGDASKAKKVLNWEPKTKWKALAELMVDADIQLLDDKLSGRKIDN